MNRCWFLFLLDSDSVCELCGYFPKAVAHTVDSRAKSTPDSLQALLCTDLWLRPSECSESRVGHHSLALRNEPRGNQLGTQRRLRGEADTDGPSACQDHRSESRGAGQTEDGCVRCQWSRGCWMGQWGLDVTVAWYPRGTQPKTSFMAFCHCHKLPKYLFTYIFL